MGAQADFTREGLKDLLQLILDDKNFDAAQRTSAIIIGTCNAIEALESALERIHYISHCGGLEDLDEAGALKEVRLITRGWKRQE